jgi:hypothetical protein
MDVKQRDDTGGSRRPTAILGGLALGAALLTGGCDDRSLVGPPLASLAALLGGDCPEWFSLGPCEALSGSQAAEIMQVNGSGHISGDGICDGLSSFLEGLLSDTTVTRVFVADSADMPGGAGVSHLGDSVMVLNDRLFGAGSLSDYLGQAWIHEGGGHLFQGQSPWGDPEEDECQAIAFEMECWSGQRNEDWDWEFCDQGGTS